VYGERRHALSGALLVLAGGAVGLSVGPTWLTVDGADFTAEVGEQVGWAMRGPSEVGFDTAERVLLTLVAACLVGLGLLLALSRSRLNGVLLRAAVLVPLVGVGSFLYVGWDFVLDPTRVLEVQPARVREAVLPLLDHGFDTVASWRVAAGAGLWLQSLGVALALAGALAPWRRDRVAAPAQVIEVRPAAQPPVVPAPRLGRP
jgi:hypothetical protein